jgi:3-hydroxy-9,10-secoandrosta-1,3,5(10)-triene-9,17-dione monooxygenase reductase component
MTAVTPDAFRRVAGRFATGVTIVTTLAGGTPWGLTVNSLTTVSLDPPLVLVSVSKRARAYAALARSRRFAVNVLADGQAPLARLFASLAEDKFDGVEYRRSPGGQPLIRGIHAWLDCAVVRTHAGGRTHTLFIAEVRAAAGGRGRPLVYHRRRYTRLAR